jgi:multidrug resistance protein, MATE family
MNSPIDRAAPVAAANRAWGREFAETLRLAWPMALTQLGQVAMMTTDLAMLGRLGTTAIAAASLAHTVFFAAFVLGMGLVSAVAPLAAQAYGARAPRLMRRAVRVGIWAALGLGLPLSIATQMWSAKLLLALGQTPDATALAARYLQGLAWCLIPGWIFIVLRGFMGAVNQPSPALWITLAAIPANALLAFGLINGAFGLPRLDALGAGLATTLVNAVMCLAAIWVAYTKAPFKKYRVLGRFWRADWTLMRQLLVVGLPMSGSFMLEFGLFAAAALIMGKLGTTELAAHQIALQVASIIFMVPFGISMAATVRVGHAAGSRDAPATRRAGFAALVLAAVFMTAMVLLIAVMRGSIPYLFLGDTDSEAQRTIVLAATLLLVGATFYVVDGLQTVAAGALRGLNDTRIPLLFAALSFWIIGFAAAYGLGLHSRLGAIGVWAGLSLGLLVYSILLVWRFHALTRDRYLPVVTTTRAEERA